MQEVAFGAIVAWLLRSKCVLGSLAHTDGPLRSKIYSFDLYMLHFKFYENWTVNNKVVILTPLWPFYVVP